MMNHFLLRQARKNLPDIFIIVFLKAVVEEYRITRRFRDLLFDDVYNLVLFSHKNFLGDYYKSTDKNVNFLGY